MTLYTKQDCGLCKKAERLVRRMQEELPFEFATVDIEGDKEAYDRYWTRVPVIVVDGEEVAEAPIDEAQLRSVLTG